MYNRNLPSPIADHHRRSAKNVARRIRECGDLLAAVLLLRGRGDEYDPVVSAAMQAGDLTRLRLGWELWEALAEGDRLDPEAVLLEVLPLRVVEEARQALWPRESDSDPRSALNGATEADSRSVELVAGSPERSMKSASAAPTLWLVRSDDTVAAAGPGDGNLASVWDASNRSHGQSDAVRATRIGESITTRAVCGCGPERLGKAIRAARIERGWSQAKLATETRVGQTAVSQWERGSVRLSAERIASIEVALGLPRGQLLAAGGYAA